MAYGLWDPVLSLSAAGRGEDRENMCLLWSMCALSLSLSQPLPVRQTCLLRSSTSFVAVFSVVRVVRVICDRWMGEENYGRALN